MTASTETPALRALARPRPPQGRRRAPAQRANGFHVVPAAVRQDEDARRLHKASLEGAPKSRAISKGFPAFKCQTADRSGRRRSLRWHYPDQVLRVEGVLLSANLLSSPTPS